jgi:hypothetical protein
MLFPGGIRPRGPIGLSVMIATWDATTTGLLHLPSGRLVRGRGLSRPLPSGPLPDLGLYLLGKPPPQMCWDVRWLRWPDFRLPADQDDAREALREVWRRAENERVEIACRGGRGRTGTALACLAVLDGVSAGEAVAFVREHYRAKAVETPGQRRYVAGFSAS